MVRAYLQKSYGNVHVLQLTDKCGPVLQGSENVTLSVRKEPDKLPDGTGSQGDPGAARERGSRKAWGASSGSGAGKRLQSDAEDAFDTALVEELRTERRRLAGEANVPAYIVLSDATLRQLARHQPVTLEEIARISGFGEVKTQKNGAIFCSVIETYRKKLQDQ